MEEIKPTYCTEEQTKLFIHKGFEVKEARGGYLLPEQWQIIEWLMIKYAIWISVKRHDFDKDIFESSIDDGELFVDCGDFNSPQEAYSSAFDYILKELI